MTPTLPLLTITEPDLASELGIARESLRACRKSGTVTEGEDWQHDSLNGGRVMFTDAGVQKIRAHLDLPPSEKKEGPPPLPVLRVHSHPANPALMMCVLPGSARPVRVRIKPASRKAHGPGSLLTARYIGDPAAGLLEFVPTPPGMRLFFDFPVPTDGADNARPLA